MLTINVLINQAPEVQLTEPFAGQRVMEGDSIRASATFTDDMDEADALVVSGMYDMQGNAVLQGGNEPVFNITDLTAGFYIVEVKVTDTFGEEATASMDSEYTLLDTDNDWSSSCSSTHGLTLTPASPAVQTSTTKTTITTDSAMKKTFPLDPCAQIDTDGDTQPDELDCREVTPAG